MFHELVSHLVHIDIHIIKPTEERNFYTLVTTGMSYRPMTIPDSFPEEAKALNYAELVICLPPDWPLDQALSTETQKVGEQQSEEYYWPIRMLKYFARFPHEYDTWLWQGHTIPNGNPPEPVATNATFTGTILAFPILFSEEAHTLKIDDSKTIHFLSLIPLYTEEMNLKLKKGADALYERLGKEGITELLDIQRKNVAKKKWGLF